MQKQIGNLLLLAIFFWSFPALGQEFIMAKVLSVDHEKMEILVLPPGTSKSPILVQVAGNNDLPRNGQGIFFPGCVVSGETIRLWGSRKETGVPHFLATDIRGCRSGGCSDPTGVRSRLNKLWAHKRKMLGNGSGHAGTDSKGRSGHGNGGGNSGGNGSGNGSGNGGGNGGGGGGR